MDRNEFLSRLREALENELNGQAVQENVQYYKTYIEEEVRNGRQEEEILAELGDPWIIARSIIDSPNTGQSYTANGGYVDEKCQSSKQDSRVHVFRVDKWWKKLLVIIVGAAVIVGIISIITGVLSFVMPILLPILFIIIIVKILKNK